LSRLPLRRIHQRVYYTMRRLEAIKGASHVMVSSQYVKDKLAQAGVEKHIITVNPYPVVVPPHPSPLPAARPRKVVFAGRFVEPDKGVGLLVDAFCAWNPHDILLELWGDGEGRELIREKISKGRAGEKIKLQGLGSALQIDQAYKESIFTIIPSVWPEPFGLVGVEANGHQRPVMGSGRGGMQDWLTDGLNGVVFRTLDPETMASQMEELAKNESMMIALGAEGRRRSLGYSMEAHSRVLSRVLRSVVLVNNRGFLAGDHIAV
jgi:glycosyltransferase involved in cell wall biosynthesis